MKSTFFKSPIFILVLTLDISGVMYATSSIPTSTRTHMSSYSTDEEQLKAAIANVFTKFTSNIGMFKNQLHGLIDQSSNEKLKITCEKLNNAINQADKLFIAPLRLEYATLTARGVANSNYCQLLKVLLDAAAELESHFNRMYKTLHGSLQGRPTAVKVARSIKPVIDQITSDANFRKIDAYLAQAAELTNPYNIVIDIAPETLKKITDENTINQTYSIPLCQAIDEIRTALEELRITCRQPSTLSPGELLRMIRKRL